jgi:23S rRNA (uracil1939-C5)-methyltransferase
MLSYADQCTWKQTLLRQTLSHTLGEEAAEVLQPFLPAPEHTGYRCRAQLKCAEANNRFTLGFFRTGTHDVVDIKFCPVLHPRLSALLEPIRSLLEGSCFASKIAQIDIGVDDAANVRLLFHCRSGELKTFASWVGQHMGTWDAAILVVPYPVRSGARAPVPMKVQGNSDLVFSPNGSHLQLRYAPHDFCQVNLTQNRALVAQVLELAEVDSGTTVYDLYCGVGNFALPLAQRSGTVVGVEANVGAIERAIRNARVHNLQNVRFYAADVARFLTRNSSDLPEPDTIVLDPPRAGAKQVVTLLGRSNARRIVYISCDQQTMLRDIRILSQAGFVLRVMRGVDMFPHTHHCEVIALLTRP